MPTTSFNLSKPIVLVGMMGAGKTAIGTTLARMIDVPFSDSDDALVKAANMTIAEIFERDGEAFFRRRETEVIERLLGDDPQILSTGGGAFMNDSNRALITRLGVSVWLKADLELLWSRVKHKTTRPLLRTENPYATLSELYDMRNPIYAKASIAVEAQPDYSIEQMAAKVLDALVQAGHITKEVS